MTSTKWIFLLAFTLLLSASDLPDVFKITQVTISPDDVTYTPQTAHKSLATCDITLVLVIEGMPAASGTISIENDQVVSITPSTINVGAYNKSQIAGIIASIPPEERPSMEDFQNRSTNEIIQSVSDALSSSSFNVSLIVHNPGECNGTLNLSELDFHLDF